MRGFTTLIAAVLFCAASLNAQGLGALSGSVTDPSGVAIPGAKVTVTEPATEFSRSVTTNEDGLYSIPSLRPAVYKLTVEAQGFRLFTESGRELLADQSATVNVKLEVGAVSEAVEVAASAAQVDTTTSTIKQVVDQRQIVELPLNGRNAAALTLLVPGAVNSPSGGADQGQTKTFPGAVTVSTNGSRQFQTSFMLDGGNNVDEYTNVNAPFPFLMLFRNSASRRVTTMRSTVKTAAAWLTLSLNPEPTSFTETLLSLSAMRFSTLEISLLPRVTN